MKWLTIQYRDNGDSIMFLIVLGLSIFAAVFGFFFITHRKFDDKKDYLYDESDSFDKGQFKRWRF